MNAEYIVEEYGARGLWYREGERTVLIECEPADGWFYYLRGIKWSPPYDKETLSSGKEREIQQRVLAWLRARGVRYDTDIGQ
jgi:hypothetical protein